MAAHARIRLNAAVPPIGGIAVAVLVAIVFAVLPQDLLEDWTWNSGVAALVPVAQPPLGTTARAILALGFGTLAGAVVWSSLYLLFGPGGFLAAPVASADGMPVLRRADSHPDAPPRWPILAVADLGEFVPPPPMTRALPVDLNQPLAAYDPYAIPPAPRDPIRPVPPLIVKPPMTAPVTPPVKSEPPIPVVPPAETTTEPRAPAPAIPEPPAPWRIEAEREAGTHSPAAPLPTPSTPAIGAPPPSPPPSAAADREPPSIDALLARLERGARSRPDAPRPTLDDTLATLRGLSR